MQLSTLLQSTSQSRVAIASLVFLGAVSGTEALNPGCAPGGNFDLSKWTLQLPVGTPGHPQSVSSTELEGCKGYTNSKYFFTEKGDGTMVMDVPGSPEKTGCVTSEHSEHCRTELRESDPAKWSPHGNENRLQADLVVTEVDGETCVGQIHIDDSISTKPVAELYYNSAGAINMGVEKCAQTDCKQQRFPIDSVPVGQRFHYEIRYEKNELSVSIDGKAFKTLTTFALDGPESYFKAGNYNQGDGPTSVHFFSVNATHS